MACHSLLIGRGGVCAACAGVAEGNGVVRGGGGSKEGAEVGACGRTCSGRVVWGHAAQTCQ